MFFPFFTSTFPPFQPATTGGSALDSPFSAFEAWTGALMAPWTVWAQESPWVLSSALDQVSSKQAFGPMAFTPLGFLNAFAPAMEQAFSAANQAVEALAQAMADSNGGPVLVDIFDTSGPFSIRVAVAMKGPGEGTLPQGPAPKGPVIDHDSATAPLPSK
ncbi:hypothetical protein [Rhodospirillum sp. A1_3_36]|uniref:hypothetical protein n=1 Tax=Rhodospirillum sp. A1_3_36 TaxID=3391666 RepID=UPI0039A452D6